MVKIEAGAAMVDGLIPAEVVHVADLVKVVNGPGDVPCFSHRVDAAVAPVADRECPAGGILPHHAHKIPYSCSDRDQKGDS